ncbi:hypothetical protein Hanom_Chr04g00301581 [Helianthus anomalus]
MLDLLPLGGVLPFDLLTVLVLVPAFGVSSSSFDFPASLEAVAASLTFFDLPDEDAPPPLGTLPFCTSHRGFF